MAKQLHLMAYLSKYKSSTGKSIIVVDTVRPHSDSGIQFDCGRLVIPFAFISGETLDDAEQKLRELVNNAKYPDDENTIDPVIDFFKDLIER
jgi:hypothetical protein